MDHWCQASLSLRFPTFVDAHWWLHNRCQWGCIANVKVASWVSLWSFLLSPLWSDFIAIETNPTMDRMFIWWVWSDTYFSLSSWINLWPSGIPQKDCASSQLLLVDHRKLLGTSRILLTNWWWISKTDIWGSTHKIIDSPSLARVPISWNWFYLPNWKAQHFHRGT